MLSTLDTDTNDTGSTLLGYQNGVSYDDAGTQQLDSPDDPVLGDLPLGGVWHARRFATAHERTTEWDGNNHVAMHAEHTRSVIASA